MRFSSSSLWVILGDPGWDLWAVYHSTLHWKPLVNGYSGGFPAYYSELARLLFDVNAEPEAAWVALRAQGPTHAVVHRRAYRGNARGPEPWLLAHGARQILFSADVSAFELPAGGVAVGRRSTAQQTLALGPARR